MAVIGILTAALTAAGVGAAMDEPLHNRVCEPQVGDASLRWVTVTSGGQTDLTSTWTEHLLCQPAASQYCFWALDLQLQTYYAGVWTIAPMPGGELADSCVSWSSRCGVDDTPTLPFFWGSLYTPRTYRFLLTVYPGTCSVHGPTPIWQAAGHEFSAP